MERADMVLSYPLNCIKGGNGEENPMELFQKLCRNDHHEEALELAQAGEPLGYFINPQFTVDRAGQI